MNPILTDITVFTLSASADYASTNYALKNCSSCHEFNPIARDNTKVILLKSASIAISTVATNKLRKSNHKTWAKVLRYTIVGLWLGAATNNIRMGNK